MHKLFRHKSTDAVHAFDEGAQVSLSDFSPLSEQEAEAIWNPTKALGELAAIALAAVNAQYVKLMSAVANPYPLHERESWPIQLQEANLLLSYSGTELPIPEDLKTPWIDQCAHQRGMTRMELAQRIVSKDTAYRTVSGFLSGVRQWHEDRIDLLLGQGEQARDELQAYDHLQGWARAEEQLAT